MYNQEDKHLAKQLVAEEKYMELIAKIFLEEEDKFSIELVTNKSNEALGEMVRANTLAEVKVKNRYAKLKQLAQGGGEKNNPRPKT